MQTLGIQTAQKPTIQKMNKDLLKFVQDTDILTKEMCIPEIDKTQKLKLVYKNLEQVIRNMLRDDRFRDHLEYDCKIELYLKH